jgi:mono/diheme cytochrome c family protein
MAEVNKILLTSLTGAVLLSIAGDAQTSGPKTKTVLDGAYTAAQASRGKASYDANCARCHHNELIGLNGPPLKGTQFLDRWREFNVKVLVDVLQSDMPLGNPGSLTQNAYIDIAAYILQANGLPTGQTELTAQTIPVTLLVGPEGPKPLPSSAQVSVAGCMIEDSGNGFFLAAATEPARTLDGFQLTPQELKEAKELAYGSQVFRLENLSDVPGFTTDGALGFKAVAKGILVRQPKGDRINVTALKSLSESCDTNRDAEKK